jgi:hypothetical protein
MTGTVNVNRFQVRARVKEHLEALKGRFSELSEVEIVELPQRDYAYRIYVPKETWVKVMAALTEEVDYNNFKDKVGEVKGHEVAYHQALMDVWWTMYRLQEKGERDWVDEETDTNR